MMNDAQRRGIKVGDTIRIRYPYGNNCRARKATVVALKPLIGSAVSVVYLYNGGNRLHSVNSVMVIKA